MNQAVIEVLKQENDIKHQTAIALRNNNDSSYILVLVGDNSCLVSANSETRLNSCLSLFGKRPSHLSHKVNCLRLFLDCVRQLTISRCSRIIFKRGNVFENAFSLMSCLHAKGLNRPPSIYQYSNMAPRLSGKNCKFFRFLLSLNSQKRLGYKESNTKYRSLT